MWAIALRPVVDMSTQEACPGHTINHWAAMRPTPIIEAARQEVPGESTPSHQGSVGEILSRESTGVYASAVMTHHDSQNR